MKNIIKLLSILFLMICQMGLAQDFSNSLSDGSLEINGEKLPVKIFATTSATTLNQFGDYDSKENTLIFLNEDLNNYASGVYVKFNATGYQSLDENFQPTQDIQNFKYLYKSPKKITENDKVNLNTPFLVWNPEKGIKIGSFTLHFYSLMFVLAFGLGFFIMDKIFKKDNVDKKYLEPLLTWTIVGTIFGARLGHIIFYQPEILKEDFWSAFLPIRTKPHFEFTGFTGLASHGATIALIFTTLYYSFKIIKKNPLWVYDRLGIVVALGGGFVRLGNFFNSEIIGKAVDANSPFAILFPQMSDEYGVTIPRYPTQLFEAGGYFLLFVLLWVLYQKTDKKYQQGWLFGLFFIILWSIRFFVEFLKEPQGDEFISFAGLNTGQILSIPFIIIGVVLMVISKRFRIN